MEFDPLSPGFFDDPAETYRWLRRHRPVYRSDRYGFYALFRYDDVVAAHRDWQTFCSGRGVTLDQLADPSTIPPGVILAMDPPDHDRIRRLVSRVFTPRAVADLEPMVGEVVDGVVEPLRGAVEFDGVTDFSYRFPIEVICRMLGVPGEDRDTIRSWSDLLLHREPGAVEPPPSALGAGLEMLLYFLALTQEKRARPTADMVSRLSQATIQGDDGETLAMSDEEVAGFVFLLAIAGSETVAKLVGGSWVLFHRNPTEWEKVLADPARISGAVEEVLRYWPPAQFQGRCATRDVTLGDVSIPEGSSVLLVTGSATRDERAYDDPDRFDVERPQRLAIGFGYGIHACLGAALARLEARIAVERMRAVFPRFSVDEAGATRVQMPNVWGYASVPVSIRR